MMLMPSDGKVDGSRYLAGLANSPLAITLSSVIGAAKLAEFPLATNWQIASNER